jgi:hypothetical protein
VKRLSITIVILLMVSTMACNKSSKEGSASNSGTTQSAPTLSQSPKVTAVPVANPTAAAPLKVSESATTVAMNPPHGQPNHRCDIAVGAPLDSPPGTGKTQPPVSQPNATTQITTTPITTTPTTTVSTAPGMNPPHGQPNHRCDIKVGEPLNSPPGKK